MKIFITEAHKDALQIILCKTFRCESELTQRLLDRATVRHRISAVFKRKDFTLTKKNSLTSFDRHLIQHSPKFPTN